MRLKGQGKSDQRPHVVTDRRKKRGENEKFRRWIKSHNFVERQFRGAAKEVHAAINCRECAECCRVTEAEIYEKDIVSLSKDPPEDPATSSG